MDESTKRARIAYEAFRGGLLPMDADVPRWEDAPSWIRDAAVVAYLQGKLDAPASASPAPPTPQMVDAALNAWFKSPPSETDQGLERSMKAALVAALSARKGTGRHIDHSEGAGQP